MTVVHGSRLKAQVTFPHTVRVSKESGASALPVPKLSPYDAISEVGSDGKDAFHANMIDVRFDRMKKE